MWLLTAQLWLNSSKFIVLVWLMPDASEEVKIVNHTKFRYTLMA